MKKSKTVTFSISTLLAYVAGAVVCGVFLYTKHFVAHNILAICFCIQALSLMSLNQFKIGFCLLGGLFFYDIFWVFGTDVMVSVAKNFDGPAKIIFPLSFEPFRPSILGLGDIVVPGFFIAMVLRFDAFLYKGDDVLKFTPEQYHQGFPKRHFWSVLSSYVLSLMTTSFVMIYFQAAQPALLYLCPGISFGLMISCYLRGDFTKMWAYSESDFFNTEEDEKKKLEGKEKEGETKKDK